MSEQIANYPVQHFAQMAEEPRLIANSKATGGTLLGEIKHRLADCAAFDFALRLLLMADCRFLLIPLTSWKSAECGDDY